jgi:hypothetical protein
LYKSIVYSDYQNIALHVGDGQMAKPGYWVSDWAKVTINFKDGTGPVNTWVNAVYRINNGKIEYSRTFYNELDILEQVGYGLQYVVEKNYSKNEKYQSAWKEEGYCF